MYNQLATNIFEMKRQYKASYLDRKTFDIISELRKDEKLKYKLIGLLESVSSFDIISSIPLDNPASVPSILAVANNLITRGTPTICSKGISSKLAFLSDGLTAKECYDTLHIIDARPNSSELYDEDLGSNFERAFLNNYIPDDKKYLTQFFQHQREKKTLTNNAGDSGRVDFSFEAPYFRKVRKTTVYQKEKELKERNVLIIEIDGKRYHNNLIDDIRDYETAKFGHNTQRITESNTTNDTKDLLEKLSRTKYFQTVEGLLQKDLQTVKNLQTAILAPIAIARLQKAINQFLIVKYEELKASEKSEIKIAIIERDVPCGFMAVADLNELYHNLIGLEGKQTFVPKIDATIFADNCFFNQKLQPNDSKFNSESLSHNDYDLIIDVSTLWRTGIFRADKDYLNLPNSIVIRSSHYTEQDSIDSIYCAYKIEYRDLTIEISNEQHKEIDEVIPYVEYFLQNIFQKDRFRKGQLPILNRALKNRTVIGLLPTGGGKSLTYQLAALLQPGITIVIDPIRSLMVDQFEGLLSMGIGKCDFINSILSREEKEFVQDKILPLGKTQFLFCSPERLVIQEFRDALKKTNDNGYFFSYCVIDEAHCVSEWGHDFRTPYLNLGENAITHCKTIDGTNIPIFGLTATASFDVLADIERELKIAKNDGKAIVRYENSVRDEINYQIRRIVLPENGVKVNKKSIGNRKKMEAQTIIKSINEHDKLLLKYNDPTLYAEILKKTFTDYLPISEREATDEGEFIQSQTERVLLNDSDLPFEKNGDGKYNYGIIIFCPHRSGELGVDYYVNGLNAPDDEIVFFKGSSDSLDKDKEDYISFENLRLFKENEASVMVATKAFGMGIDKPNVRLTVHCNIASSIESFVQESGRAGRDGKTSLSVILYNNQIDRDRQVLENFHKKSFKGADKERSVIWELRNKIFFPRITNLQRLAEKLRDVFDDEYKLTLGEVVMFIRNSQGTDIGRININTKRPSKFSSPELTAKYLEIINNFIPEFQNLSADDTRYFLNEKSEHLASTDGLEKLLSKDEVNFSKPIIIPFKNRFFSKDDSGFGIVDEFAFEDHYNFFKQSNSIKWLLTNDQLNEEVLREKFLDAIKGDKSFDDFINSLPMANQEYRPSLIETVMLRVRYYIPRSQEDTAKAIYRLTSIGIIDTYTIEYQEKVYKVLLNDPRATDYFKNYEELVGRYTSRMEAEKLRRECEADYEENREGGKATIISKCLEHLTNFIYEKIADKRRRAIDDMVGLCEETIMVEDPFDQSKKIKENIYYYFNAKYAREGNMSQTQTGEIVDADLNRDFVYDLPIEKTIWKYIEDVIDYDDNGQIINNIKHLRGATMRMLRGTSGTPQFNILKAYSLYFLSSITPNSAELIKEAIHELKTGINDWFEIEPDVFNFESFFLRFKGNLTRHIGELSDELFGDVDDDYYTNKNLNWLVKFNSRFLKEYNNAITTST